MLEKDLTKFKSSASSGSERFLFAGVFLINFWGASINERIPQSNVSFFVRCGFFLSRHRFELNSQLAIAVKEDINIYNIFRC